MAHSVYKPDGAYDWSGGVDSNAVTTIASERVPNGIKRNQLCWANNCTVRDGAISPRAAYQYLGQMRASDGLFQGWFPYDPLDETDPYIVAAFSGRIFKVTCTSPVHITDLSASGPGLTFSPTLPYFFFVQGEEYLVIQCGDLQTLPLFWNNATLRRSKGINNQAIAPGTPNVNEIPAAGSMDYYMQRLWYSQGRTRSAGDIVGGASGAGTPGKRGSILNVTENPLCLGGDGFTLPTQTGNIRVLTHNANINAPLGQGQLITGTRKALVGLVVPVSRTDWIAATTANQPEQPVLQLVNGPVNDRSVTKINGDLYFVALEPSIRSLFAAIRNYSQPGNISISAQIERLTQFNDRALLKFTSGVFWDNRLLETQLPVQLAQGVACPAVAPLDFVPISTLGGSLQPVWEGVREGPHILQFASADFGGLERAFAAVVSTIDGSIEMWELTKNARFDLNRNGESRITWVSEFPAFTWGREDELKRLVAAELGVDRVFGEVIFKVEYRQDNQTCWLPWSEWKICSARNNAEQFSIESVAEPTIYPLPQFGDCYRSSMVLPVPPVSCSPCGNKRPSNEAYQFQTRITVKGYCRIRRWVLWAEDLERELYENLVCAENLCIPVAGQFVPLPVPVPVPVPTPPPAKSGWKVQDLANVLSQLVQSVGPACGASAAPAWDGIFNLTTIGQTGIVYWYFIAQSISSLAVSADLVAGYPAGFWMDVPSAYTQLYWDGIRWFLWITCVNTNELWFGQGPSSNPTNPAGVYTALDSPTPATITIAHT